MNEKLSEVNESNQNFGDIVKKSNIPRRVIENTHNVLPKESEQIHPSVIYVTSLENTLINMKYITGFSNREGRKNGDILLKWISS